MPVMDSLLHTVFQAPFSVRSMYVLTRKYHNPGRLRFHGSLTTSDLFSQTPRAHLRVWREDVWPRPNLMQALKTPCSLSLAHPPHDPTTTFQGHGAYVLVLHTIGDVWYRIGRPVHRPLEEESQSKKPCP